MTVPLGQRVANHTLRSIRLGMRLSQNELAAAVRRAGAQLGEPNACTKRLVQKWESGEHEDARPNYRRALEAVTRTSFTQLGFRTTSPEGDALRFEMPVFARVPVVAPGEQDSRTAMRLRVALARPARMGPNMIGMLEAELSQLFISQQHRPARAFAPAVHAQVDDVAALLAGTASHALRQRLSVLGGAGAALAGWLALEQGQFTAAQQWWDSAMTAARHSADNALLACVLVYQSHAAAQRGDPATGWMLTRTAATRTGLDQRSQAWMAARCAQDAAHLGEHTAALKELQHALSLAHDLPLATAGEHSAPWARFVDAAYVHAVAAHVHGHFGDHDSAFDHASQAGEKLTNAQTKTRALVLAEIACAAARAGRMATMAQCATEAADLAAKLHAHLALQRLRALHGQLKPFAATPTGQRVSTILQGLFDHYPPPAQ